MRPRLFVIPLLACAFVLAALPPASGWGFEGHRFVMDRAIDLLPPALRPFYERHRAYVVERSIDPDLWRTAGFSEEAPRHFLNLDAYGSYPFLDLPRDYDAAVAKFGRETIVRHGLLPWRAAEIYDRLVQAFRRAGNADRPYAIEDVKFFSAVLSHYVGDAHVPFHAVRNHDGQLTGQRGIHARFESELFRRHRDRLSVRPPAPVPVNRPRDFIFDALLASVRLVEPILDADRRAAAGRDEYDDGYFEEFLAAVQPILERRIGESISAVAGAIIGAWEAAGRPELPPEPRRVNRRIGVRGIQPRATIGSGLLAFGPACRG